MNGIFDFKAGDYVFFTDQNGNDYVDIIGNYNPENNSVTELVSVMIKDRQNDGEEEGFIYYHTLLFLASVRSIRRATKEEVKFCQEVLTEDGYMFDRDSMDIVSIETKTTQTFRLTRTVVLSGCYQDTIGVEAENLQIALNKAAEFNSCPEIVWKSMNSDKIMMDESGICHIEIASEDGSDYRELDF